MAVFRRRSKERDGASDQPSSQDNAVDEGVAPQVASSPTPDRSDGPFDRSEVDDVSGRLDFGSLLIAPRDGMQLHLEMDEAQQGLIAVTVVLADTAVQLQAFAAPRTAGVWPEIRSEIAQSIVVQGGTADVVDGPFGRELHTRMPQRGPDGRTAFQPARFIGVDGPRWFLRAVISGAGAADPAQVAPALALVRATVVERGDEPMAPRDLLPLRLPKELAEPAPPVPEDYAGSHRRDDFSPFERGPEITEIH